MKNTLTIALALGSCSLLAAQQELRIAGLDNLAPVTWGQETEDGDAAIKYDELPDEHTLLMVHTTIDESVAGPTVTAGITQLLPFMAVPDSGSWTLTHPALVALDDDYDFVGADPRIPPQRLANYAQAFVAASYGAGYGTNNVDGSNWVERTAHPTMVLSPELERDERWPWANTSWTNITSLELDGFSTSGLGRQSVIQAAYEFHYHNPQLPPIDATSMAQLNDLLDQKLGFEIYVQALHIKAPSLPTEKITVRISRYARIRRRSLLELSTEWLALKGYQRHVTNIFHPSQRWYLAPMGDELQIEFPFPVGSIEQPTTLVAYIPTAAGLEVVPQTANPIVAGELLEPCIALFSCPSNTTAGIAYFEATANPLVPVLPVGTSELGAFLFPFNVPPPANPAPPQ